MGFWPRNSTLGGWRSDPPSFHCAASVSYWHHLRRESIPSRLSAKASDVASVYSDGLRWYMRICKWDVLRLIDSTDDNPGSNILHPIAIPICPRRHTSGRSGRTSAIHFSHGILRPGEWSCHDEARILYALVSSGRDVDSHWRWSDE